MELSGITAKTPDPAGGQILRDAKGNPIGAFLENAQGLIRVREPKLTPEEAAARERREVELAAAECLKQGVTTFHDADSSFRTIDLFRKMAEEGTLGVRLYVMIGETNRALAARGAAYRMIGAADNHLTVRAIKRFMDGALGSHGAWLLEPYADLPGSTGMNTDPLPDISETAKFAIENGFQLCIHAIGDRANREVLNIYEEAFKAHPRQDGRALARRARPAPRPGRHPALRPARRHRLDAGRPLHVGRAVGAQADRREEGRGGRLRLAEAHRLRRRHRQRHGRARRARRPDARLLRRRDAQDEGRHGLLPGGEDDAGPRPSGPTP